MKGSQETVMYVHHTAVSVPKPPNCYFSPSTRSQRRWRALSFSCGLVWLVLVFIVNSFVEIPFTYHTMYPFKVYNSVVFSIFTELCDHHHNFVTFVTPQKETPYLLAVTPQFFPIPPTLGNH